MQNDTSSGFHSPVQDELNEFLDEIAQQDSFILGEQETAVTDDVRKKCHPEPLNRLRTQQIDLKRFVQKWNRRLRLSLRQDVPPERLLCGFNAFIDAGYPLGDTERDAFLAWLAHEAGIENPCSPALSESEPLPAKAVTAMDVLAYVMRAMQNPEREWKPLMDSNLSKRLKEYFPRDHSLRCDLELAAPRETWRMFSAG